MPVFPKGSGSLIYENGRDDRIRTCGLIVPNDARYQTVPHPDIESILTVFGVFVKYPTVNAKEKPPSTNAVNGSIHIKWCAWGDSNPRPTA